MCINIVENQDGWNKRVLMNALNNAKKTSNWNFGFGPNTQYTMPHISSMIFLQK